MLMNTKIFKFNLTYYSRIINDCHKINKFTKINKSMLRCHKKLFSFINLNKMFKLFNLSIILFI